MGDFIQHNIGTIIQLAVTAWLASIARNFEITLKTYSTRLEAHREAVRRGRALWFLDTADTDKRNALLNETMDWLAVNEVYLEPLAAQAVRDIHLWRALPRNAPQERSNARFAKASEALDVLSEELLRFRKRTFWEWLRDRRRAKRSGPARPEAAPTA